MHVANRTLLSLARIFTGLRLGSPWSVAYGPEAESSSVRWICSSAVFPYWGREMSKPLVSLQASGRLLERTPVGLWERVLPRAASSRLQCTCSARKLEAVWLWIVGASYIRKLFSQDLKNSVLETHILSIVKWSLLLKAKFPVCQEKRRKKKKKKASARLAQPFLSYLPAPNTPPTPPRAPSPPLPLTIPSEDFFFWGEGKLPFFCLLSGVCVGGCSPGISSWPSSLRCNVLLGPAGELLSKQRYLNYYPCS